MEPPKSDNTSQMIFALRFLLFFWYFLKKGPNDQKLATDLLQSVLLLRI